MPPRKYNPSAKTRVFVPVRTTFGENTVPTHRPVQPAFVQTKPYTCYDDFQKDDEAWGRKFQEWKNDMVKWRAVHGAPEDEEDSEESEELELKSRSSAEGGEAASDAVGILDHDDEDQSIDDDETAHATWIRLISDAYAAMNGEFGAGRDESFQVAIGGPLLRTTQTRSNEFTNVSGTSLMSALAPGTAEEDAPSERGYGLRCRALLKPTERARKIYRL